MFRRLLTIFFILAACSVANATDITLSSWQSSSSARFPGNTATVRFYSNDSFTDSNGKVILVGTVGSTNWYQRSSCTVAGAVLTCASIVLPSTTDSSRPTATFTAVIYNANNAQVATLFTRWKIPNVVALGTVITFAQLEAYNNAPRPPLGDNYYTRTQVNALIASSISGAGAPSMTDEVRGIGKLSAPAVDAANPIVLSTSDPLWLRQDLTTQNVTEYASLAAAVTAIGATPTALLIPTSQDVAGNITIPSTLSLIFTGTGALNITDSSKVVTINGPIEAPLRQIFTGSLTNSNIVLGTKIPIVRPEWWGLGPTAIQSAVNSITSGVIELSTDYTAQTVPVYISSAITLQGNKSSADGYAARTISGTVRGPIVYVGDPDPLTYTTSLATGSGQAISVTELASRALFLNDTTTTNLHGLSAFTAECFIKPTSLPVGGNYVYIMGSWGIRPGDSPVQAFALRLHSDDVAPFHALEAVLTTSAGVFVATTSANAVIAGTTYHVAATYDGATLRLFKNGVLVASTAATGTIVQQAHEDISIGGPVDTGFRSGGVYYSSLVMAIDSIRLSNIAKYVAGFTNPTAKFASDANALLLLNNDATLGPFTLASSKDGTLYIPYLASNISPSLSGVAVTDLNIVNTTGMGLHMSNTPHSYVRNVAVGGTIGFYSENYNFLSQYRDIRVVTNLSSSRIGVLFTGHASAGCTWEGGTIEGFPYGFVSMDAMPHINGLFMNTQADTIIPMWIDGGLPTTINEMWLDDEVVAGAGVTREAGIVISNSAFNIKDSFLWMSQSAVPIVKLVGTLTTRFGSVEDTVMNLNGSATEAVQLTGFIPTKPVQINNSQKFAGGVLTTVPWSTSPYVEVDRASVLSPAQITANQNNYTPASKTRTLKLSTDASRNITGLAFTDLQIGGEEHVIYNDGSFPIVLVHNSTSTPANRFSNLPAADITLAAGESAYLWYDATAARWKTIKLFNPDNPGALGTVTPAAGNFTTGSFTGTLTGVAGTFSGAVSGTTGTFSSAVSGTSLTASTTLGVTGVTTPTGGIAAAGGFSFSPRLVASCGTPAITATQGTDTTPVNTETYIVEVFIPANSTVTGVALLNGSAVAGNVKISLATSAGVPIAGAVTASTAQAGTAVYQLIPFAVAYAAKGPATYYILIQFSDNTTPRFRSHTVAGMCGASKKTGEVYGTFTTVTAPSTFTASIGPVASLY